MANWTEEQIQAVWEKGAKVVGYDSNKWRKDQCGAWMARSMYGDQSSRTNLGWQIDHISPGGPDTLSNLRPLQWYNNSTKSDGRLKCPVTAKGNENVLSE